jgi:aminoglycoside phosphotransferase (APT) family kinase protein
MLSSLETDLIRRDPAVPGLATVLDPDAIVAALRQAAPKTDLRNARITYVRYKPQRYCRVAYRLDVAGTELDVDVRACRPEDFSPWLEESDRAKATGPLGPGCIILEQCSVLVFVFPNDLKLPALQRLTDPVERKRMLREMLPDCSGLWQGELRCLRYRPERRYVAQLRAADETPALLKAYTRKDYERCKHNVQAFQSSGLLRVARLLGCSDGSRLLAFEWLPGRLLMELCTAPELDREAVTAVGGALATLHGQDSADLAGWTRAAEAAELLSLSSEIGFICPQLARRADELARRFATQLAGVPARHCALHGDFSANQVLVSDEHVSIIDLDWACSGDPAEDLGNFLAQAERFALRGELPPGRVELLRDALLDGYARATNRPVPDGIGLYTALQIFRRTRFPFRTREPQWTQRTESLLDRAETILNALNE